ncbi:hypothetical protein [uncultured Parabacteroides sp.]|uniref:hypothetical protein n=1 Tax=uncultured Parabacteroides sp. TaxID=512312 RepID=UPI002627B04B|nr:hypothetical protein [uncultured Parabacteroides sp.]
MPGVAGTIGNDDRLHGGEVNFHGHEDGRHRGKPAKKRKKNRSALKMQATGPFLHQAP